jgi:hypothetical protein
MFKARVPYAPYFYLQIKVSAEVPAPGRCNSSQP